MLPIHSATCECSMSRHSYIRATDAITIDDEQLKQLRPSFKQSSAAPSPPTTNNFEFPSLLESLCQPPVLRKMPSAEPWLDDEVDNVDDIFHSSKSDQEVVHSDTITVGSSTVVVPNNTRHALSTTNEVEALLSDDDSEVELSPEPYSLESIIQEARLHYQSTRPDFCVKASKTEVREVQLTSTRQQVEIRFHDWEDGFGYWTYTDGISDSYVVKWKAGKYYIWEGVNQGYSSQPFATTIKSASRSSSEPSSSNTSSLRERTIRQLLPYSMYNVEKAYDKQGVRLSEARLEEVVQGHKISPESNRSSKKRKHQGIQDTARELPDDQHSSQPISSTCVASSSMSVEGILQHTTLRTRFHAFDKATIPIAADKCGSHDGMFDAIRKKWAFQLHGRDLSYCIVKFPWHGDDKNLLLQESDTDGFTVMVDELRRSPLWHSEERVEVVIEIYTEHDANQSSAS